MIFVFGVAVALSLIYCNSMCSPVIFFYSFVNLRVRLFENFKQGFCVDLIFVIFSLSLKNKKTHQLLVDGSILSFSLRFWSKSCTLFVRWLIFMLNPFGIGVELIENGVQYFFFYARASNGSFVCVRMVLRFSSPNYKTEYNL